MSWLFGGFFAVLALCLAVYLICFLRSFLTAEQQSGAVVTKRYKEEFPFSVAFARKNRTDRYLTFTLSDGREVNLPVGESLYTNCPVGTAGVLHWRGERLVRFEIGQEDTPSGDL